MTFGVSGVIAGVYSHTRLEAKSHVTLPPVSCHGHEGVAVGKRLQRNTNYTREGTIPASFHESAPSSIQLSPIMEIKNSFQQAMRFYEPLSPPTGNLHPCREQPEWCAGPTLSTFLLQAGGKAGGGGGATPFVVTHFYLRGISSGVRAFGGHIVRGGRVFAGLYHASVLEMVVCVDCAFCRFSCMFCLGLCCWIL